MTLKTELQTALTPPRMPSEDTEASFLYGTQEFLKLAQEVSATLKETPQQEQTKFRENLKSLRDGCLDAIDSFLHHPDGGQLHAAFFVLGTTAATTAREFLGEYPIFHRPSHWQENPHISAAQRLKDIEGFGSVMVHSQLATPKEQLAGAYLSYHSALVEVVRQVTQGDALPKAYCDENALSNLLLRQSLLNRKVGEIQSGFTIRDRVL